MGNVNVRKRGKVYQYQFEVGRVNGKRKSITKSGFRTKNEAQAAGKKAQDEYNNGGICNDVNMSYADYLDIWIEEYCKDNLKHRTIEEYSVIANRYLKPDLGHLRLNKITSFQLNQYFIRACIQYNYSYGYMRNFLKVIKSSFREACNYFGFITYNPAIDLKMPKYNSLKKTE